jgi:hypothetical protein
MDVRVHPKKTGWARKAHSRLAQPHFEYLESLDALRSEKEGFKLG